jgi:hypothetical protein
MLHFMCCAECIRYVCVVILPKAKLWYLPWKLYSTNTVLQVLMFILNCSKYHHFLCKPKKKSWVFLCQSWRESNRTVDRFVEIQYALIKTFRFKWSVRISWSIDFFCCYHLYFTCMWSVLALNFFFFQEQRDHIISSI